MKLKNSLLAKILLLLLGILGTHVSLAAVSENFDTGWPNVPWGTTIGTRYYSNAVNSTTQWQVNNAGIWSNGINANSFPYSATLSNTAPNTWVLSSMLTSSLGKITFAARNVNPARTILLGIESSYETNMINWITNAVVTNTLQVFTNHVISRVTNPSSNQYIRLIKYSRGSSDALSLDDISIADPGGSVALPGLSRTPANPADNETVSISATVSISGSVEALVLTNYWHVWPATNWTAIAMTSNSPTIFTTSSSIPGKPLGAIIEYYAEASYTADGSPYAASSGTDRYTVRPLTSFTNLVITGGINTNMTLTGNFSWQGVVSLSNLTNAAIKLEGTSNSLTTVWGDTNQVGSSMPLTGTAETGTATSIILHGTNVAFSVINFNETNRAYTVQACSFNDFDSWANSPFGSYTNSDWVLSDGQVTNDTAHVFRNKFVNLNGSPNASTNSFLKSPFLTNGIGQISFWYRNWETNATPGGTLLVQVAPSATATVWTTISTLTNIISPNYLFHSVAISDRANHSVRILNNPTGNTSRVCLDEVTIAEPGAGVLLTNLVHSPSLPIYTNNVTVQVNISPAGGTTLTNVTLVYRTTVATNSLTMTNSPSSTLYTATIPPGQGPTNGTGLVEYYVSCGFDGFGSQTVSPAFSPLAGPAGPTNFVISRSYLVITNVTLQPSPPVLGAVSQIEADITPRDGASNIIATAFYRIGLSGGFTSNSMVYSGISNRFTTTNGIPAQSIPGTPIYYSITATCQGGYPISPTNYPALGTNSPLVEYVGTPSFVSSYSNLQVTGSFSTNLILVGNYFWQGVANLSNATNATFRFAGMNGATSYWGVTAQSVSNFPYYGTATNDASSLTLYGTNSGYVMFQFNETNLSFSVRRCNYMNFEQWTNAAPYGSYTNGEGWILSDGRTTTNSPVDNLRVFAGAGRSGILREGTTTNAFLLSPYLTNGVGQISLWYSNAETNSSPPAQFSIQVATTPSSTWTTLATITNIASQDYLYAAIPHSDPSNHYVRILNNTNTAHAALCVDEIILAEPGASVLFTNLTHSPSVPVCTNPVNIAVTITPGAGAVVTNVTLFYRPGTNALFTNTVSMTTAGAGLYTASIPPGQGPDTGAGIVEYYVKCGFQGFDSELVSPLYSPAGGAASPTNYVISRSYLIITNVSLLPNPPLINASTEISADIIPRDGASNIVASLLYRVGFSGAFSNSPMVYSGISNRFVISNGFPAQSVPGTPIFYTIRADCQGGNPIAPTNYPALGTNAPLVVYTRTPTRLSSYSNLQVTGSFSTNLLLVDNYTWQGVATLSNVTNATVRFAGINGSTSYWGLTSQTISNFPYYGTAVSGATSLTLFGTNSGYFSFEFNETNQAFVIQRCNYLNFDQWTNASPYGPYTNSGNWILSDGRTTTNSATDDLLRFANTGRSGILREGPSTNAYLISPYFTNGMGKISFWYRNRETNASATAQFSVQTAANPTSTWTTIATYTNILSQDYLYASIVCPNRYEQYARILNDTNASHAALCLDEIVITDPGAGVNASNLTNSPAQPNFFDDVYLSVDLTPISGALITNAVAWFRLGTSGMFESLAMTNSGTHWSTATPIHRPDLGTLQYAVQYFFAGFQSASPAFYPPDGTNSPASFEVIPPADVRSENFDIGWPNVPWGTGVATRYSSNAVNSTTLWQVRTVGIWSNGITPKSFPYSATLNATSPVSWVMSSMLTNGIGAVSFAARNVTAGYPVLLGVESSYDTNMTSWVTNAVVTNNFSSFSNQLVTTIRHPTSNQIIRLVKYSYTPGANFGLSLDDIVVSYPPVNVAISNVFINPGYPATGDSVRVSCDVISINPLFPAYGIAPTLYYRRAPSSSYSTRPMIRVSETRYETPGSLAIPPQTRDTKIEYYIECEFTGYHGSPPENMSPQRFPSRGPLNPTNYIVRSFSSVYSNIAAVVNGQSQGGRLLNNGSWQSIINLNNSNTFSLSIQGYGYFNGSNYATTPISWGQTNSWKTGLPLADAAGTNQSPITISGTFDTGQYLVRFNEATGRYLALACLWQDFDQLSDTAGIYKRLDINVNAQNIVNSFDSWSNNATRVRVEDFGNLRWSDLTSFTNNIGGGDDGYLIFGSRINAATVQTTNVTAKGQAFVVQPSHWGSFPLRGVGTVSYKYKSSIASNATATVAAYLFPTSSAPAFDGNNFPNDFIWSVIPGSTNAVITNVFRTSTVVVQTNTAFDIIVSHDSGESIYLDDISVSEWYAETRTNDGWLATDSWIEPSLKAGMGNCCRFDPTRASPGTNQYIQTPALTNGIYSFSFQYCGATTNPVSFDILLSDGDPSLFTNTIDSVTNLFDGSGSNYTTYSRTIKNNLTNLFLRIKSTTQAPGVLLMDDFKITPYALGDTWALNNTAIDATSQQNPPAARQFYAGACYLNNDRTSNISTDPIDKPDTNEMPNISTPVINGIGEISFWYRNWATSGSVTPARLLIQKSPAAPVSWTTILMVTNIINTNDYLFFQSSVYDTNASLIRICNDDTYTTAVGRVCVDDVLITTPMASSVSMSNLVITPAVPLFSNTVKVAVDVYHLFLLDQTNLTLTTAYGTGSTYSALASASFASPLAMTCISTNLAVPGRSYRYETVSSIPALPTDTYVKYEARANFEGYHPEIFSPTLNRTFTAPPTWYNPLPTTGMTYYVVFSCPTGAVWINEVNYGYTSADKTNEYVELCGPTGADVRGWSIWLANSSTNIYGAYTITNQNAFGNPTNGYGFWTLGDSSVLGKSMVFTNAESAGNHLYVPGGIRLLRSNGSYADSVCYGIGSVTTLTNAGFKYIGRETSSFANSSLFQTGTVGALFWVYTTLAGNHHTPSQVNESQWFPANGEITASPTVTIVAVWMNTNVWIECSSTNFWLPTPWYSTNLMNSNGWTNVAPFWSTYPTLSTSNTYTLHFAPLSNNPVFFKIITTNAP